MSGGRLIADAMLTRMRRPAVIVAVAIAVLGLVAGGLAALLDTPKPPRGALPAERLYYERCVVCHGTDGRGSWRAALFLVRPGDLSDGARMSQESDRYLVEIIKNGGAPIGRPGMPAFGDLSHEEIEALVSYVRGLGRGVTERR